MRRDPVPAYYRIYQVLSERIATRVYRLGSQLPTDAELMAEFGVSRHTARSAVEELVSRKLARRFPGRGTFVLESDPESRDWSARALEDLRIHDPEAPSSQGILRISWSRVRPTGPIAFCRAYLPQGLAERLPSDIAEQMRSAQVIPLIEKYCGVQAFRVQQASSAISADAELAKRLEVEPGAALLLLQRTYFDIEGVAIYYSDLYVRSDRFVPKIELFRHRQQADLARPLPAGPEAANPNHRSVRSQS